MSWIQTYTGRAFDVVNPTAEMVCIEDIAHALANLCRFTGHCREFYSVAQHSILVAEHLPDDLKLQGLLHDATEAYCGDVSRPLKRASAMSGYKGVEQRIWDAIAKKFGLPATLDPLVKEHDNRALETERRDMLGAPPHPWEPLGEPYAENIFAISPSYVIESWFLHRFADLTKAVGKKENTDGH